MTEKQLDREAAKIFALSSKELDKYEYLTGEDLGYKPGVTEKVKFEYSPLGVALSKGLKKDDRVNKIKYDNDLVYNSVFNFNKYSVSNFNEISSLDSKFDTLNKFYKDFENLKCVKSQTNERKQNIITVLKNVSILYNVLVRIYKKEYNQVFQSKDEDWRQKHDYKNLKDLDYQPDQPQQSDQPQPPHKLKLPKWVKVTESRFDEIQSIATEAKNNKLKASVGKKVVMVNSMEELIKDIASRKIKSKKGGKDKEIKTKYYTLLDC